MEDSPAQFTQHITQEQYDREAVDYTTVMVEQLNANVRAQPSLGAQSTFFQDPDNVKKGLPVFQGKHTRFVYDSDDDDIVAAVDVTHGPLPGPHVRTVADLDSDQEGDDDDDDYEQEEEEEDEEEEEQEDDDMGVANEFYVDPSLPVIDDSMLGALMEDVAMELASFGINSHEPQP